MQSPQLFKIGVNLTETLPLSMIEAFASSIGDHKMKKSATMMKGISKKMVDTQVIFFHFINNMWHFELGRTD